MSRDAFGVPHRRQRRLHDGPGDPPLGTVRRPDPGRQDSRPGVHQHHRWRDRSPRPVSPGWRWRRNTGGLGLARSIMTDTLARARARGAVISTLFRTAPGAVPVARLRTGRRARHRRTAGVRARRTPGAAEHPAASRRGGRRSRRSDRCTHSWPRRDPACSAAPVRASPSRTPSLSTPSTGSPWRSARVGPSMATRAGIVGRVTAPAPSSPSMTCSG